MPTFATRISVPDTRNRPRRVLQTPGRNTTPPVPISPFSHSMLYSNQSCACGGGCPRCQVKSNGLRVSQPNAPAEIEADWIADAVMRMSEQDVSPFETDQRVKMGSGFAI